MKIVIMLLLLVAVGTAYDAYAQTNSERIRTIESTTSDIKDAVDGIVETLSPIADMVAKLDNVLVSTAAINSDLSEVKSTISGFNTALLAIQTTAESNRNQLNGLTSQILEMNSKIDSIQTVLGSGGSSGIEQRLDLLKTTVDNNNLAISTRLQAIETSLGSLGTQLQEPAQVSSANLVRKVLNQDVNSYDYKVSGNKRTVSGDTVYFLDMTFSCDGPVSIDSVSTDVRTPQTPIIPTNSPNSSTKENYLKVDNRDLYNSRFEISSGSYSVFNHDAEFNLRHLLVGSTLDFSSRQVEDGTRIADSTRSSYSFEYQITVEYLGSQSVTCTLDTGRGTSSNPTLTNSDTLLLTITADTTSSIIKPFRQVISCNNDPVQITNIIGNAVGSGWSPDLASFASFDLQFPNDASSNVSIGFDSDGAISPTEYPISFSNSNMEVRGSMPNVSQLLVQIQYSTVAGGSCTAQ